MFIPRKKSNTLMAARIGVLLKTAMVTANSTQTLKSEKIPLKSKLPIRCRHQIESLIVTVSSHLAKIPRMLPRIKNPRLIKILVDNLPAVLGVRMLFNQFFIVVFNIINYNFAIGLGLP